VNAVTTSVEFKMTVASKTEEVTVVMKRPSLTSSSPAWAS
jgi:hypothetical protein